MRAIVLCGAIVDGLDVHGVLQRAIFNERPVWNVFVVARQAHDEAETDLGVWVQLPSAEFDNVAHAFG